jgi:hypothetical protein
MAVVLPLLEHPVKGHQLLIVRLSTLSEARYDECLPGRLLGNLAWTEVDSLLAKPHAVYSKPINYLVPYKCH